MNLTYNAIIAEIPEVDELKQRIFGRYDEIAIGAYECTIVAVYRQGRVDQLSEWVGNVKTEKGE